MPQDLTRLDHLTQDELWDERAAAAYDTPGEGMFADDVLGPTVDLLEALAAGGPALELAIGTGRVAIPLAERGVPVSGIELSRPMIRRLQDKVGGRIPVTHGDMATARAEGEFSLVYLVFNTIANLLTQDEQVRCFQNAAAHLRPGGCFVIELWVPDLRALSPAAPVQVFAAEDGYLGLDVVDTATQRIVSHHVTFDERVPGGDRREARLGRTPHRYVWPSELDLMARLAGMSLEARYADWSGAAFTSASASHVSYPVRMTRVTQRRRVTRLSADGGERARADVLAGEEPLEVRVGGRSFSVTMRTPGHDFELAAGFLHGEGVIRSWDDVAQIDYRSGIGADGLRDYNVVNVELAPGVAPPDPGLERHVYTSSSCGICGTASIESVRRSGDHDLSADHAAYPLATLLELPDRLRDEQALFDRTGGVHAAGLFLPGGDGLELVCLREDVGRHNAVDKVVGWALREVGMPLRGGVLQVSGRASFELVQKAALAGIPILSAVSAPSSLAADLAEESGMTLIGFNRGSSLNVYCGRQRVD